MIAELKPCPAWAHQISVDIEACPNCGYRSGAGASIKSVESHGIGNFWLALLLLLVVLIVWTALGSVALF